MDEALTRFERADGVRVAAAGTKGRGVYAARPFAVGELIERVPVVLIRDCEREFVDDSFLCEYLFWWDNQLALALGSASLFNHSYSPNAGYVKDLSGGAIDFVALRPIAAGEEIVVNYNGDPTSTAPVWFEVRP
jgi:uncharacterized protein